MLRPSCVVMMILVAGTVALPCYSGSMKADEKALPVVTLETLGWLTGAWMGEEDGVMTEEYWMAPRGGIMPGVNRSVSAKGKASFEYMRIAETPDGLTFFASPSGQKATPFLLKEGSDKHAIFESGASDFPNRIIYRLKGEQLTARIEGVIEGKEQSMDWVWKPVRH